MPAIRKEAIYMAQCGWEPSVPSERAIREQVRGYSCQVEANDRLPINGTEKVSEEKRKTTE